MNILQKIVSRRLPFKSIFFNRIHQFSYQGNAVCIKRPKVAIILGDEQDDECLSKLMFKCCVDNKIKLDGIRLYPLCNPLMDCLVDDKDDKGDKEECEDDCDEEDMEDDENKKRKRKREMNGNGNGENGNGENGNGEDENGGGEDEELDANTDIANCSLNWLTSSYVPIEACDQYDAIILPCGKEQTIRKMLDSHLLKLFLERQESRGKIIAAIGNAILVLCCFELGLGKCITIETDLRYFLQGKYGLVDKDVCVDNALITARSVECAEDFMKKIIDEVL